MPQLDKFAYFSQILWLALVLIILYSLLIVYVLPTISTILKFRAKFVQSVTQGSNSKLEVIVLNNKQRSTISKILALIKGYDSTLNTQSNKFKAYNSYDISFGDGLRDLRNVTSHSLQNIQVRKTISSI